MLADVRVVTTDTIKALVGLLFDVRLMNQRRH